jgi:hypothetical protein
MRLAVGRMVRLRIGQDEVETLDTVRFDHLLAFARSTGKSWPVLEHLTQHQDGSIEIDAAGLIDEMQRLSQERPSEKIAPLIGLLRNDATRVQMLAAARQRATT